MSRTVDAAWTLPTALRRRVGHCALEVLYVRIPYAAQVESTDGIEAHEQLMGRIADALIAQLEQTSATYGVQRWPADDFVAWREGDAAPLRDDELHAELSAAVADLHPAGVTPRALAVSSVPFRCGDGDDPERVYARALRDAQRAASDPAGYRLECSATLLDRAIKARAFVFHHQPIVDCAASELIAYEALCRGTMDDMKFPDLIFGVAERTNRVWQVGRVLRNLVAEELDATGSPDHLHFINIHPSDIDDPVFLDQATSGLLSRHAHNIVFELTERAAIQDYRRVTSFFRSLQERGYRLAIDDLGSGYAGLTALAELDPDFIKFDMSLIRDLHLHPVKQRLIRRMHQFATEIGARTISEGVETPDERDAVLATGCTLMQGYFFARPARGFEPVPAERFGDGALRADAV